MRAPAFVKEVVLISAALGGPVAKGLLEGLAKEQAQEAEALLEEYLQLGRQERKARMATAFAPSWGVEGRVEALAARMPPALLLAFSLALPPYFRPKKLRAPKGDVPPKPWAFGQRLARECLR
jgi:hypothetical protein